MEPTLHSLLSDLEQSVQCDPGRRGLLGDGGGNWPSVDEQLVGQQQLAQAASSVVEAAITSDRSPTVAIVTGFYIPFAETPRAETDGPAGTVVLASALQALEIDTIVITDELCAPVVEAAMSAADLPRQTLSVCPMDEPDWPARFLAEHVLSHLISVERVGPGHTSGSIRQPPHLPWAEEFLQSVPASRRGQCSNMRGRAIDRWTAPLHLLFEPPGDGEPAGPGGSQRPLTIGIGDGANEIGMGRVPWGVLRSRLAPELAHIPCRIATDWNLVAGTSNWGALALAAACIAIGTHSTREHLRHTKPLPQAARTWWRDWPGDRHLHVLEQMCKPGGAIDGVTGRCTASVDGLPFSTYIQPWQTIQERLEAAADRPPQNGRN